MATQYAAKIAIKNNTGGNASILLFHSNYHSGTQRGQWQATSGQTVGSLTALYSEWEDLDYWSVLVHVQDGPTPGFYVSGNVSNSWVEYQMQSSDSGKATTFSVDTKQFDIVFSSGTTSGGMTKIAPASPITHVFVVMLENHSFDHMFAMSGIPGITAATTGKCNSYQPPNSKLLTYCVQTSTPLSMTTDPGHEFLDVLQQLTGRSTYQPGQYPTINNSGFATNYATSCSESTGVPKPEHRGDIMGCLATPIQLQTFYDLATTFTLCDRWHSSMPGPTWPNRFFVHGASSSGLDTSPSSSQIAWWEKVDGFQYPKGSIYQALHKTGIPYRFYNDYNDQNLSIYSDDPQNGSVLGAVPQVLSLDGITSQDFESLNSFESDLQGPYPYPYTFIEPHYGDVYSDTYVGGSSQHPMDDVYGGEHLLAAVYAAIRKSPYWNSSLLIITYDEHGGLYDCVAPGTATPPGDNPTYGYNVYGFDFTKYGVRVPAVIVSPLIPAGVNHTLFDHSSIPRTLEDLFGLKALTNRDAAAQSIKDLLLSAPRTDCPMSLNSPAPLLKAARPRMTAQERAIIDAQPLPERGNLIGALWNLRKAEIELSGGTPPEIAAIQGRFAAIQTRGDARAYAEVVMEKIRIAREQRRLAQRRRP
jgi:phospholipase C